MLLPSFPHNVQVGDQLWELTRDWVFWDRHGREFLVRAGYRSNGLSIPRPFRSLISVSEDSRASFAHDFLYESKLISKWEADVLLFDYMYYGGHVYQATAHSMFWVLTFGGWYNWWRC